MNNVIYYLVSFFISTFFTLHSLALVPIEGLIFGDVKDIEQYDPLVGILNFQEFEKQGSKLTGQRERTKLESYYGLYKLGTQLKNKCEEDLSLNYLAPWQRANAKRSVVATLQYIGLDISLKSIAEYAKKLEYSNEKYKILVKNLMKNTCSKNVTVYSLKLLRDNFMNTWKTKTINILPSIEASPYFSKDFKAKKDTLEVLQRELNYSLRNFRAFCSWNGDTSDYRMLSTYLRNPYIMSFVFNHLKRKKIIIDQKTKEYNLVENTQSIQVACEDMICRRRKIIRFDELFPRMIGTTNLGSDLENLYCRHFLQTKYLRNSTNIKIQSWIKEQTNESSNLESLHFLSLLTNVPDPLVTARKFSDLRELFTQTLKGRWDKWAEKKLSELDNDHLYEEPLVIKLVEQKSSDDLKNGKFNILFDVGLSEVDRVLEGVDKIDIAMNLKFTEKYLAYLKEKFFYYTDKGQIRKAGVIKKKLVMRIAHQMNNKKSYFEVPIWNDDISEIIADELLGQLNFYLGGNLRKTSRSTLKIPVRFRFGVFALRYIRHRYLSQEKESKMLAL